MKEFEEHIEEIRKEFEREYMDMIKVEDRKFIEPIAKNFNSIFVTGYILGFYECHQNVLNLDRKQRRDIIHRIEAEMSKV